MYVSTVLYYNNFY